jgi:TolA-binding protein
MRRSRRSNSFNLSMLLATLSLAPGAASAEPPTPIAPASDQPRKTTASRYQTGIALLNRGLNDAAEKELRAFLGDDPASKDAANARYALAIALSRQSRFEESAAELSQVASLPDFKHAPDATLLLAQCHAKLGRDAEAAAALGSLLNAWKDYARLDEAAAMRAECLQRLGSHGDVISALAGFADRWATSSVAPRATLILAISEAALSKHAEAATHAEAVLGTSGAPELLSRAALVAARARESLGSGPKRARCMNGPRRVMIERSPARRWSRPPAWPAPTPTRRRPRGRWIALRASRAQRKTRREVIARRRRARRRSRPRCSGGRGTSGRG